MSEEQRKAKVLVVDDDEQNRVLLADLLELDGYECEVASDGFEALAKIALDVDIVLLDLMMPNIDGFEVARRIRANDNTSELPIIMVTSLDGRMERINALECGANDFITKPVDQIELRARTKAALRVKRAQDALKIANERLESSVVARTNELRKALSEMAHSQRDTYEAQLDTIRRLAVAAEFKDTDTAEHIYRMAEYCRRLGRLAGLTPRETDVLYFGSLMHDVGKIGIPDAILLKPGRLTTEERRVMEEHTTIGSRILADSPSELISCGRVVALSHHEKWDGSGYPNGLTGNDIPLSGRICAIADVFDALRSKRPYKESMGKTQTLEIMADGRGSHFDPALFDLFIANLDEITSAVTRATYSLPGRQDSDASL